ncbi:MAG: hypothetical protein WDZ52_01150 [Pseudohongiellaceae bacterium]
MNKLDEPILLHEICRRLDASLAYLPNGAERHLNAARLAALMQDAYERPLDDDGLANIVGRELNEHSSVPPEIEARLDLIRQKAIVRFKQLQEEKASGNNYSLALWFRNRLDSFNFNASAGMLASACVLITAISIFYVNSRPPETLTIEEEIGLVATAEDIELYENLEFYLWLAENESLTL